ncbi:Zinc finger, CCHC-type domain containing [Olea europaea subsp. europaea]|uniref:Zinc finger, CCHC-type domain containing n=1 Tax=Olea europaea subsp. europaea TaxID=158383 RepID=A0A8S0PU83_OLEEU|nr:Zinc finger, CCHC-type domain containing [Olea europaea subsp. europaea]
MTNRNDDDVDLGLSLGSTNHCVRTTLNNSSGAGVNANSGVDIAFAASDPLSELVWSPHKGLSLKCADPDLAEKNPFVTWNVGPINKVFSPSQSIRSRETEDGKAIDKGNSTILQAKIDMDEVGDGTTVAISPRNSPGPLCNVSHGNHEDESGDEVREGFGNHNDEHLRDNGENLRSPENVQNPEIFESSKDILGHCILTNETSDYIANMEIASSKLNAKVEDVAGSSQIFGFSVAISSESHAAKNSDGLLSPLPNLQPPKEQDNEVTSAPGEENEMKMHPLMKLESSDENDSYHLTAKEASSSSDERFPRDKYLPLESAPKNSMIFLNQSKSKEKALCDGDDNGKLSNCEEGRQESVESCNSAGFFPRGKRRRNYDKDFSDGRKKLKNQIQGSSGSTSMIRHGNSFMNWISSMVKCIPNSSQGQAPPLVLPLAHLNDMHDEIHRGILISKKENDSPSQPMGFQTIFQSLYCPRVTVPDTSVSKESHCLEESKELVVADNTFLENPPITCHTDTDNSCKKILASNAEVNPCQSTNLVGQYRKPWNFTAVNAYGQDACKRNLAGNKPSRSLACSRENAGMSPSDSLHQLVNKTADNTKPSFHLEGKVIGNMSNESGSIPSLWITRFSTKTPRLENCNQATDRDFERSTVCTRVSSFTKVNADFPNAQKSPEARVNSPEDQVDFGAKEMQSSATNSEASLEFKSIGKFDPILLSQCKSSEVMACVFAQRLDALRHITPSNFKCSSTFPSATCFICGGLGHDMHDCPDITETELDDLVRNASSFYRVEKSPPLCLRCFQLDHWAITCPMRSTSRHHQLELNASFANQDTVGGKQLCASKEKCSSSLGAKEDHPPVFINQRARRDGNRSFPSNLLWNVRESSGKRTSSNEGQNNNTSNSENDLKGIHDLPLQVSVSMKYVDTLIEMFDVVKKLRISRADVLRWKNSNVSLSHLNGFFLRLRIGKWGTRLGGTGYYVACITESTGAQREKLRKSSKNSVCVDISGIQCFVGSQYVSNHEFFEVQFIFYFGTYNMLVM